MLVTIAVATALGATAPAKPAAKTAAPVSKSAAPSKAPAKSPAAAKPAAKTAAPADTTPAPARKPYANVFADGPGRPIADGACLLCHSPMLVTQQAKDSAAWEKTLTQMIGWGSPVTTAQRDTLRRYLLGHYGTHPPTVK
ncbi:MAG: hypothetical protein HYR74_06665 [Candidatus Eisenbacteria bacterium]|nr:hypothetical protein [Candidatus Eisenbacteria bacterium]